MKFILCVLWLYAHVAFANQDDDFLVARDAFRAGDVPKLAVMAQRLKNTPFEVYTTYYQLKMRLDTAEVSEILSYLSRTDDTPLIDRLRADWLKMLARKQQWGLFDREYPHLIVTDAEINCDLMQSRMGLQESLVLQEAHALWFSARDLPESCSVVFESAINTGIITQQDIWQRLRLALESANIPLAKLLAPRLNGTYSLSSVILDRAMDDPAHYLDKPALETMGQRTVALFALQRLARSSPDLAWGKWHSIAEHFSEKDHRYFFGWLAYEAARKHDVRAVQWYKTAGTSQLNEQQLAWRVRAALRVKNWQDVLLAIHAMSETQQRESAWRYWCGYALLETGRDGEAEKLFLPLSLEHSFYGQLAAEALGNTAVLSALPSSYQATKKDVETIEKLPGVRRALALYRMDLRTDAMREWSWLIRNFNDQQLLAAAEVARQHEMYDRAINTADKTVLIHDFSLRYLAPYRAAMREHIEVNKLEEAWVYGLMRQESRFVTSAKSGVGASGLMQVMPTTARWIAKKLGLKGYRDSLLHQLDTNLTLGTYYMKSMLSSLDDSPVLASAAYNAGPGRARRWRAETPLEGAIYTETIPFDETRDYVKKVMSNTVYYAQQFGAPSRSLKQRVGIVGAKAAEMGWQPDDKSPGASSD